MHTDALAHTTNTQKVNQGFANNIDVFEAENAHLLLQNA